MHSRRLLCLGLVFLVAVNLIHATTYEVAQPVAGPISITAGRANWALSWRCRPEPRCLLGQISCWCCNWPPARMRAPGGAGFRQQRGDIAGGGQDGECAGSELCERRGDIAAATDADHRSYGCGSATDLGGFNGNLPSAIRRQSAWSLGKR